MGANPRTTARAGQAIADSRLPAKRADAVQTMIGLLQPGGCGPDDQARVIARLFELFEDGDPRVFRSTMDAVAAAAAALDEDVQMAMLGRLATMGANPDKPQANDALRALKRLENEIGPERPPDEFA